MVVRESESIETKCNCKGTQKRNKLGGKNKLQTEVKRAINYSEIAVLQIKPFFRKYRVQ